MQNPNSNTQSYQMGVQLAVQSHTGHGPCNFKLSNVATGVKNLLLFFEQMEVGLTRMPDLVLRTEFHVCEKSTAPPPPYHENLNLHF